MSDVDQLREADERVEVAFIVGWDEVAVDLATAEFLTLINRIGASLAA